jgi:hypothetical protein
MNQNSLNNDQSSLKTIQLDEVGDKLSLKDRVAIKKWLKKEDINLYKIGKKSFIYEIELDYALSKPYLMSLRRKSPTNWKQLYKMLCNDETLYEYTLFHMKEEPILEQLTKVKPHSMNDKKLLEQLLG